MKRPERLKKTVESLSPVFFIGAAYLLSTFALSRGNRIEAGRRDGWQCQANGDGSDGRCLGSEYFQTSEPLKYHDGYWVQLAHYSGGVQQYRHPKHDHPDSARCLCTLCHAAEELTRGNIRGAKLLLETGLYSYDGADENGGNIYPDISLVTELLFSSSSDHKIVSS